MAALRLVTRTHPVLDGKELVLKVSVNWGACASTGSCVQSCPEVFEFDVNGQLRVVEEPDESLRHDVLDAAEICPTAAITVGD